MLAGVTVSFGVLVPVTYAVVVTVVVQPVSRTPLESATVTEPSTPPAVAAPVLTAENVTGPAGTVMARTPAVMVKVATVLPVVAAPAGPATPAMPATVRPVVRAMAASFELNLIIRRFLEGLSVLNPAKLKLRSR